jgi:hypothetical protein
LRKRAQDRYADAKELASDIKTVQREIESGISTRTPLTVRLQEQWQLLRDRPLGEWALPGGVVLVAIVVLVVLAVTRGLNLFSSLILPAGVGLLLWRRFRHRRLRLARKFVRQAAKMAEVRVVTLDGMRFTVLADRAQARTYVRANALLDSINRSMFFGDPFTLSIRDSATPEDERALLTASGILYVREDPAADAPGS